MQKKTLGLLCASMIGTAVMAQTATPAAAPTTAPEASSSLTFNVGAVSDYRFRGISQTAFNGALQGGADYAHKSGLYVGLWGSNVKWIKDYVGASAGEFELDIYGGYKGSLTDSLSYDVGAIGYQYPDNTAAKVTGYKNADTTEVYVSLTYSVVTAKYSYSTDNFIANANSTGAKYLEVAATFDLGSGFSITPHVGRQTVPNQANATGTRLTDAGDYTDYALSLGKDFGKGISASLTGYGLNADESFYTGTDRKFLGKNGWAVGLKYTF